MSWLLLGIVAILIIFVIIGAVKGFSQTLLGLASIVLSLVISWFVTPSIHTLIQEKTTWETGVATKFEEIVLKDVDSEIAIDHLGEQLPLPSDVKTAITATSQAQVGLENKKAAVSTLVAGWLMTLLIQLVLFLVLEIIFSIVGKLLARLIKKTDLAKLDRILGALLGLAEGVLIVDAILLLVPFFTGTEFGNWLSGQITVSKIMTWIYNNNIVSYLAFTLFNIKL